MTRPYASASASPLGLGRPGAAYLVLGGLAIAGYGLVGFGPVGDLLFVGTGLATTVAVFAGIRRTRPKVRSAWLAVGLAMGIVTAGNLLAVGLPVDSPIRESADLLFLLAYLPLFLAAFRFGRGTHRSDRTVFLDTGVVGLAAVSVVWELLIEPNARGPIGGPTTAFALTIPVVDVLLISLVAPLLLLRFSRSASAYLFVGGLLAMCLGDSIYAVRSLNGTDPASLSTNLCWLGFYVLLGAAALAPSAHELGAARDPRHAEGDIARHLIVAIALLVAPLVLLHQALLDANLELIVFAGLMIGIAALVIFRLRTTIGQLSQVDVQFRRFTDRPGFLAVIKDAAGRYVYMNPAASRAAGITDGDWFGRTDAELFPSELAAQRRDLDATVRRSGRTIAETVRHDDRSWHTERFALRGSRGGVAVLGLDVTEEEAAAEAVRFQARLLESVRDVVIVLDPDGVVTYWNQGAQETLGYSAEEMVGHTMKPLLVPGSEADLRILWTAVRRGEVDTLEWHGQRRDGRSIWLDVRLSPITDEHGQVGAFLAVAKDVTASKESQVELARLGAAIDNATDGVIVTDPGDHIVYVNPAFERIIGLAAADVRDRRPNDLPGTAAVAEVLGHARSGRGWRGDVVAQRRDGTDLVCAATVSPIAVEGHPAAGFVTILRDVTQERSTERAAERRARERALIAETLAALRAGRSPEETTDAVCSQVMKMPELGVATFVTFDREGLATAIAQWHAGGRGMVGVALTPSRSAYLRDRAAAGPWVERWVADSSHPYSQMLTDLGIVAHAYAPLVIDGAPLGILIAGATQTDAIDRLTERLPALVEFAAIANTLLADQMAERNAATALEAKVRSIIANDGFREVFQPIVGLKDGAIHGYEALTRFADGTPPDVRFEQAHRVGLGLDLEAACLGAAFREAERLPAGAWLNVNVSPALVLAAKIEELLPANSRQVVLEITEHEAITDYARFREAVDPVRDRVRIAIDDAGAGFASLRHIIELAPALVKLDRSLVAGVSDDLARQAVIAGMVRFADAAGMTLVAEGIETEGELEILRRLGVELGQGFLFGSPSAAAPGDRTRPRRRHAPPSSDADAAA